MNISIVFGFLVAIVFVFAVVSVVVVVVVVVGIIFVVGDVIVALVFIAGYTQFLVHYQNRLNFFLDIRYVKVTMQYYLNANLDRISLLSTVPKGASRLRLSHRLPLNPPPPLNKLPLLQLLRLK